MRPPRSTLASAAVIGCCTLSALAQRTVCIPSSGSLTSGATACVTGFTDPTTNTAVYTVHSSQQGWVALSVGTLSMSNGDAVIGWTNTTGSTLTQPITTFEYNIRPNSASTWKRLPLEGTAPSWASISFTVSHPFTVTAQGSNSILSSPGLTSYVVGFSARPPSNRDSAATTGFAQHSSLPSSFSVDILPLKSAGGGGDNSSITIAEPAKPILEFGSLRDNEYVNLVHGVLMFVAWGVAPFIGIFIARFLKDKLGVWWFRLHVFFFLIVCGFLTIAGFLIIGLTVIIAMIVQMILGVISDRLWSPDRESVPIWDKAHWWIGRLTTALALINIFLGIDRYNKVTPLNQASNGFYIALGVWIAAWIGIFVYGQMKFGQVHHIKGHSGSEDHVMKSS
ncbi:hypothetical protein HDU67_003836 [Dinochytrium kinnereticum]|nr:hypothetical protein HDU67_003836 [Dinochytrium kinnereticum]